MTNIFKIDTPIRRSLYFVISTLVTIAVVIEGQVISPWTIDVLNNNTILINIIEVSIYLFFTYIYFTTDSKRIWQICGSKQLGIVPGVVANGSFLGQIRFRKPGGHALGRSAYSVDIQPVAACTHDTTHTCRTELQVAAKPALEFLLVIPNSKQLCFYCLGKTCITPKFVSLHVVHFPNLLFDNTYKKGSSSHIC